ncbi:hypothetical protein [Undibacterium sp. WLHG33]|uniref:hypothetical protein n=1 Tax=Undibacterium sp. WLHG33 TaxID=3412482 RepID=UPI003C2D6B93
MAKSYEEKQFTQLSGEFGVVSELCRRQIQASLTYGNSKSADVFVIDGKLGRSIKVEVKTSVLKGWVVDARALNVERHIIWVFVYMPKPNDAARVC